MSSGLLSDWIQRLRNRTAPSDEPDQSTNAQPTTSARVPSSAEDRTRSATVTFTHSDIPDVNSAYGYGHLDGRNGVDAANFQDFIVHSVGGEALDRLVADLEGREGALEQRETEVRALRAEVAYITEEVRHLGECIPALQARVTVRQREFAATQAERADTAKRGSLLFALLYTMAGIVFIAGDIVMSQKTVADALELTGESFLGLLDESWVFAIGLAMISILLKPAYDRLIEEEYWERSGGKKFAWAIGLTSGLAIVSVAVLGIFRMISFRGNAKLDNLAASTLDSAAKGVQIARIQEMMQGSAWGTGAFVLSGVLFAIAGAICLGIGLRHCQDLYHVRLKLFSRVRRVERQLLADEALLRQQEQLLPTKRAELQRMNARLSDLPSVEELTAALEALRDKKQTLLARWAEGRIEGLRSVYRDGYALGASVPTVATPQRRKSARPFIAIRRAIRRAAASEMQTS